MEAIQETALTQAEITRAATNDPALSTSEFTLGDRTFKVLDLPYDDYLKFITLLQPLFEVLFDKLKQKANIAIPGIEMNVDSVSPGAIMRYCAISLPEMVRIICAQSDPSITVADVKRLGKTPVSLAKIVMIQVVQNNVIKDFSDFFALFARLMKGTSLAQ